MMESWQMLEITWKELLMNTLNFAFSTGAVSDTCPSEQAWTPGHVGQSWTTLTHKAITLEAQHAGSLRVSQGRVWVTLGEGVLPRDQAYGDVFLDAGQELVVAKGQRLVLESMFRDRPACFLLHYTHEW
jgi:Protein of unknown function (DUF2917)